MALSVAIIGVGKIAGGYDEALKAGEQGVFTHAAAYQRDGRFHISTVVDSNLDRAKDFCKTWSVDAYVDDLGQLTSLFHDVISVCTPDETHEMIVEQLIQAKCCKTIFVEKPLCSNLHGMQVLAEKAQTNGINIVVNFQRQFDTYLLNLSETVQKKSAKVLAVNAYYMKGLSHIGTTMIDTLVFIFGLPQEVMSYERRWNKQVNEYSYEFILYYEFFNITVKTVDSMIPAYHYHIFEIDILFSDRRITVNDNSRQMVIRTLTDYSYTGVKVLNDICAETVKTNYNISMLNAVSYIYEITSKIKEHYINTPLNSIYTRRIVDAIIQSFNDRKRIKLAWSNNEKS